MNLRKALVVLVLLAPAVTVAACGGAAALHASSTTAPSTLPGGHLGTLPDTTTAPPQPVTVLTVCDDILNLSTYITVWEEGRLTADQLGIPAALRQLTQDAAVIANVNNDWSGLVTNLTSSFAYGTKGEVEAALYALVNNDVCPQVWTSDSTPTPIVAP